MKYIVIFTVIIFVILINLQVYFKKIRPNKTDETPHRLTKTNQNILTVELKDKLKKQYEDMRIKKCVEFKKPVSNEVLQKCQVGNMTQQQCFENEHYECPPLNGSYEQCTNNYIPQPKNNYCECHNRWFSLCPFPYKVSEKCINKDK